ncbi:GNAT family N-acetyltransferase [Kitasatospora sp. NBC_00070]|uniref:GNAT family N-acetyltransferase n=1 Tax=Kitasatospora sp. NBC_00070 TaxID=2975962 RepID=UPI00324BEB42
MTTTLRPESPEELLPSGGRSRRWLICVNGRPVGGLRTSARPYGDQLWGEISQLEVTEGRRRGRATVGALAAEEVLRAWDCRRVDVSFSAGNDAARGLAETLGYTERMLNMVKELSQPADLPTELTVRPIGPERYGSWLEQAKAGYLHDLTSSGLGEQAARAKVENDHQRLLREGHATPGTALRELTDAQGVLLGSLWLTLRQEVQPDGEALAWVMSVAVEPEHRGHGYGRALMLLAERECLAAGVRRLGLNVFSGNTVAVRLYESLGYRTTRRIMGKSLA